MPFIWLGQNSMQIVGVDSLSAFCVVFSKAIRHLLRKYLIASHVCLCVQVFQEYKSYVET